MSRANFIDALTISTMGQEKKEVINEVNLPGSPDKKAIFFRAYRLSAKKDDKPIYRTYSFKLVRSKDWEPPSWLKPGQPVVIHGEVVMDRKKDTNGSWKDYNYIFVTEMWPHGYMSDKENTENSTN